MHLHKQTHVIMSRAMHCWQWLMWCDHGCRWFKVTKQTEFHDQQSSNTQFTFIHNCLPHFVQNCASESVAQASHRPQQWKPAGAAEAGGVNFRKKRWNTESARERRKDEWAKNKMSSWLYEQRREQSSVAQEFPYDDVISIAACCSMNSITKTQQMLWNDEEGEEQRSEKVEKRA